MLSKIKNTELKLQLEKMVIGLSEPILIKGGGKFLAKVDSGNGGYNVIHGEDFVRQGDILNFKTFDQDGNEKRISKKIKDTLNVHIGGGNIQERPVIELDIKFADEDYKKIPFTVTDRSSNKEKVLISKDFVQNQLDALIDVSKTNMTENEPVEVEYVTESKEDKKDNIFKRIVKHPIKAGKVGVNKATGFLDKIARGVDSFNEILPQKNNNKKTGDKQIDKNIGELEDLIPEDKEFILKKIRQEMPQIQQALMPNNNLNAQEIQFDLGRALDYTNHIMYGDMLEIENSLIGKDLNKLAGINEVEQKTNVEYNKVNAENNIAESYFDKWMKRYEYLLTEKVKRVPLAIDGIEFTGYKNGNTLNVPGSKLNITVLDGVDPQTAFDDFFKKAGREEDRRKVLEKVKKQNGGNNSDKAKQENIPQPGSPSVPSTNNGTENAGDTGITTAATATQNSTTDQIQQQKRQELINKYGNELKIKKQFCLYFCANVNQNSILNMFNSIDNQYVAESKTFLNNMSFNDNTFSAYMSKINQSLVNTNEYKNGCCGLYALCTGEINNRNVKLFYDQSTALPLRK